MAQSERGVGWRQTQGFSLWTTNIGEETILHPKHAIQFENESKIILDSENA